MKINNILVCLCLLLIFSCQKDDFQPDYSNGSATATRDGENWRGEARGGTNNLDIGVDFVFTVYNEIGETRQTLGFQRIPLLPDAYALYSINSQIADTLSGCYFITASHDGDVVEDVYKVVESPEESTLTVLSYDEETRTMCGIFDVMLYRDTSRIKQNIGNPEMIHFEDGEFEVKLAE